MLKIYAHILKYLRILQQIFAATKSSKNSLQKQAKLIAKIKLGRTYCKIIKILALA
jgi:hypothetical protein